MFVASNIEGLVATHDIVAGSLVIEYSGCFSLAKESSLREKLPAKNNFVLKYMFVLNIFYLFTSNNF